MEEVKNTTVEETTVVNNAEETKPSFGEKMKAGTMVVGKFVKDAGSEKIEAYEKDPLKEGFKDLGMFLLLTFGVKGLKWAGKKIGNAIFKKD